MKHKKLLHIGLAAGDLALFFGMNFWVEMMFLLGVGAAVRAKLTTLQSTRNYLVSLFYSGRLYYLENQYIDIIQLLIYPVLVVSLFALLAVRVKSLSGAMADIRMQLPTHTKMLWILLPLGICFFLVVTVIFCLIPEDTPLMQEYIEASEMTLDTPTPVLSFIVTVVCAPLVEEFVFRGLIYNNLKQVFPKAVWLAVILQGMIFGAVHGQLLWMLYAGTLGIFLSLVYDYFESLTASMFVHLIFNFCNYLPWPDSMFEGIYKLLIVLFAALLGLSVLLLLVVLEKRKRVSANALKAGGQ